MKIKCFVLSFLEWSKREKSPCSKTTLKKVLLKKSQSWQRSIVLSQVLLTYKNSNRVALSRFESGLENAHIFIRILIG